MSKTLKISPWLHTTPEIRSAQSYMRRSQQPRGPRAKNRATEAKDTVRPPENASGAAASTAHNLGPGPTKKDKVPGLCHCSMTTYDRHTRSIHVKVRSRSMQSRACSAYSWQVQGNHAAYRRPNAAGSRSSSTSPTAMASRYFGLGKDFSKSVSKFACARSAQKFPRNLPVCVILFGTFTCMVQFVPLPSHYLWPTF